MEPTTRIHSGDCRGSAYFRRRPAISSAHPYLAYRRRNHQCQYLATMPFLSRKSFESKVQTDKMARTRLKQLRLRSIALPRMWRINGLETNRHSGKTRPAQSDQHLLKFRQKLLKTGWFGLTAPLFFIRFHFSQTVFGKISPPAGGPATPFRQNTPSNPRSHHFCSPQEKTLKFLNENLSYNSATQ